ncbi:2-keto-3-deoxy-L-rhamnonate aldolase [Roseobacter sp. HKCCD9010]|uniref:HpcH/HpaI aldolase family protein n=1 Tax=unclassified Roseobacter TaxID=196798 RepID=UPI001490FCED|nr:MULTISPECIES: HpcH/HpaI aldolase/citrate lyase family protein [unclassified Roseobacter]MBF9050298.1 2-keto-3-deoxy-L-rhamnonate aldolase [Rhodobacterales bacterium HKCCD4356]NNV12541.1 2-keto-3-deoxy-L-rhamnonate aldolase [Roseobacter sp. HKCCD7357]NNV15994.1 2-keto-3-deoxy-L-rhamnonate aldolase [Roseobacter sp. HKCCD8768]NNV25454.1 2-keto-3-deoxy-L-rhamnonate aldolase [Roseobacter sp. HKCCD8192]NNV29711.1 2-keto-3-deoxy-L-rhamnonate aldolase [Roseobacter sp. HKCCD9061]
MPAPINPLKAALKAGQLQRGLWLSLGSDLATEIAGQAGFDWCLIDAEHGPFDPGTLRSQLIALAGTGTAPVVRVPINRDWVLKQVLDLGAQTVLVPMVDTEAEARAAVRACRYPPDGVRGFGAGVARAGAFGAYENYPSNANDEICVLVQAESRAALDNLDAICTMEGVDGVFIGPADLAADMGYRDDLNNPEVLAAIDAAIGKITASGKPAGIISFAPEMRAHYADLGVTFLGMGSEAVELATALRSLAQER